MKGVYIDYSSYCIILSDCVICFFRVANVFPNRGVIELTNTSKSETPREFSFDAVYDSKYVLLCDFFS